MGAKDSYPGPNACIATVLTKGAIFAAPEKVFKAPHLRRIDHEGLGAKRTQRSIELQPVRRVCFNVYFNVFQCAQIFTTSVMGQEAVVNAFTTQRDTGSILWQEECFLKLSNLSSTTNFSLLIQEYSMLSGTSEVGSICFC